MLRQALRSQPHALHQWRSGFGSMRFKVVIVGLGAVEIAGTIP
jgi:hypothetical protein